jgi:hypothetical protein
VRGGDREKGGGLRRREERGDKEKRGGGEQREGLE